GRSGVGRGRGAGEGVPLPGRLGRGGDAVLPPPPARRPPLMVGSSGERMLAITLPHVDAWSVWYADYGNTPQGFAAFNARITSAALAAGRAPGEIARSACVLVSLGGGVVRRQSDRDLPAVEGDRRLVSHLRGLAAAGAHEASL